MAKRWYYQMLMEDFGPVTAEQVSALIEEGTLGESDLIRAEDSDQWFEVSQWSPDMVVTTTEPLDSGINDDGDLEQITDLSELSFEFEDSPTSSRPRRDIPSPVEATVSNQRSSTTASESRQNDLSNAAEAEQSIYYYRSLGQILGPLPLSSLISLAESGALAGDDSICIGNSGNWKAANSFSELSSAFLAADTSVDTAPQLSLATQKRLGAAASAAAIAPETESSPDTFELDESVKEVPVAESKPVVRQTPATADDAPEKSSEASRSQKPSGKGKQSRKGAAKRREDAILEDIFEDVFSEDDAPPARPAAAIYAAPAQPMSNAAMSSVPSTAPAPQYSPPAQSPPAYRPSPAPMPMPSRSKSGGGSSDAIMMLVKIVAVLVLVGGVGAGAYFGLSGMAAPPIADYATKLKAVAEELKKFDNKPTEAQWAEFSKKQAEFSGYQNALLQSSAGGPEIDKTKMALTMFLRVASTRFKDPERIKKTTQDFLDAVKRLP